MREPINYKEVKLTKLILISHIAIALAVAKTLGLQGLAWAGLDMEKSVTDPVNLLEIRTKPKKGKRVHKLQNTNTRQGESQHESRYDVINQSSYSLLNTCNTGGAKLFEHIAST